MTGFNNDFEGEKWTTLALQIDKMNELGQDFGGGLEAIGIAERQGRHFKRGSPKGIQDRSASLAHFGVGERAGYRWLHWHRLAGRKDNFKLAQMPSIRLSIYIQVRGNVTQVG